MEILQPDTWAEALEAKAAHPEAKPIAGGTDVMVELNFDHIRPPRSSTSRGSRELTEWAPEDGRLRIGAGVPYTRLIAELGDRLPGLAIASRTVGSPQIRNRGTVGGNLGTSSPAGDGCRRCSPATPRSSWRPCAARRRMSVHDFVTGPKRNCLAPDELIAAFFLAPRTGPQQFAKIGTRNAMVIAVCSLGLSLLGRAAPRRRLHRLGGSDADPGHRRPRLHRRRPGRARPLGVARARSRRPRSRASASSSRPPRGRSTTSAAPPPTATTRCACWAGARWPGPGRSTAR